MACDEPGPIAAIHNHTTAVTIRQSRTEEPTTGKPRQKEVRATKDAVGKGGVLKDSGVQCGVGEITFIEGATVGLYLAQYRMTEATFDE
jgi:hypothetical protein